jgi:hypothetical protein
MMNLAIDETGSYKVRRTPFRKYEGTQYSDFFMPSVARPKLVTLTHEQWWEYCATQIIGNASDELGDRGLDPWFTQADAHFPMLVQSLGALHNAIHTVHHRPAPDMEFRDEYEAFEAYLDWTTDLPTNAPVCCLRTLPVLSDLVHGTWEEDIHPAEATKIYGRSHMDQDSWDQHYINLQRTMTS